jgi:hypothetical protein
MEVSDWTLFGIPLWVLVLAVGLGIATRGWRRQAQIERGLRDQILLRLKKIEDRKRLAEDEVKGDFLRSTTPPAKGYNPYLDDDDD